jgi:hypothetical protein
MTAMLAALLSGFMSAAVYIMLSTFAYGLIGFLESNGSLIPLVSYLENHIINTIALFSSMSVIVILGWLSNRELIRYLQQQTKN